DQPFPYNPPTTTHLYTLSLHDALPISNALNGGGSNMIDRRKFLAAASAGVSAAHAAPKLALAGGTPVRAKALKAGFWGPQYYGEEEQQQLKDVLTTRRPFRWYGPGADPPLKVATFEKE